MNALIALSVEDHACLRQLLDHECPRPWPDPAQAAALAAVLDAARVTADPETLQDRAGLGDRVSLVCTSDPRDTFHPRIVLPCDANVDLDRIPVILPISLAVLGRRNGETVSWETAIGTRTMRIVAVEKQMGPVMAQ